jgi:hypothetical protein
MKESLVNRRRRAERRVRITMTSDFGATWASAGPRNERSSGLANRSFSLIATFSERVTPVVPKGVSARTHVDSQSGGSDLVEVCPVRINEKAPTKSRGCHYLW